MKKLKQAKAEAKTDLEKLTSEYEEKYKNIEVSQVTLKIGSLKIFQAKIMDSTFEDSFNKVGFQNVVASLMVTKTLLFSGRNTGQRVPV